MCTFCNKSDKFYSISLGADQLSQHSHLPINSERFLSSFVVAVVVENYSFHNFGLLRVLNLRCMQYKNTETHCIAEV